MIYEQKKLTLVGLKKSFSQMNSEDAFELWQQFFKRLPEIKNCQSDTCYAAVKVTGEKTDYFCGIEVSSLENVAPEMQVLVVPPSTYAKFKHIGSIENVSRTVNSIYEKFRMGC